jgi:alkaline phosphatase
MYKHHTNKSSTWQMPRRSVLDEKRAQGGVVRRDRRNVVLISAALLCSLACRARQEPPNRARNVILVIADGMGPAQMNLAVSYARDIEGRSLNLEKLAAQGMTGYALPVGYDALVLDSAASASQIATGLLARNETLSLDSDGREAETILEWAEDLYPHCDEGGPRPAPAQGIGRPSANRLFCKRMATEPSRPKGSYLILPIPVDRLR